MYSNFTGFRNSCFSSSFFVASLAYTHSHTRWIYFAIHSFFFFFNVVIDLFNFLLPGHSACSNSSILSSWIFWHLNIKWPQPKVPIVSKPLFFKSLRINSNEIKRDNITNATKCSFLKVLYVCKTKKKNINFEQYASIHFDGPKITICETASDALYVINASFTTKDH